MKVWRLIDTPPAPGHWNMAVDEALAESVARSEQPVLRLYRWSPACLSLGRNQPARGAYDLERLREAGIAVVRRPTGGSAVLHARELTYAAVFPVSVWGDPRAAYVAVHRALARGLRSLGVPAGTESGATGGPVPSNHPCFADRTRGEVAVDGRKLIGSAVRRFGRVLLQHGSLLMENDQESLSRFVLSGAPPPRAVALRDLLPSVPPWHRLSGALTVAWEEEHGARLSPSSLNEFEVEAAHRIAVRYEDDDWTWRR